MSICMKCGASIADEAKFCNKCGAPQSVVPPMSPEPEPEAQGAADVPAFSCEEIIPPSPDMYIRPVEQPTPLMPQQPQNSDTQNTANTTAQAQAPTPKKKFPVWIPVVVGSLTLVFSLMIVAGIVIYNQFLGPKKVDLNACIAVEVVGSDQHGQCITTVNTNQLTNAMYDALNKYDPDFDQIAYSVDLTVYDSRGRIYNDSDLKNGDVLTIKASWNNILAENARIKLVWKDVTYVVGDLPDVLKINPFDYVVTTCSGDSGYGWMYYSCADNTPANLVPLIEMLTFEPNYNLCNGDTVVLSFPDPDNAENYAAEVGYGLVSFSKNYTVSGLTVQVKTADDLTPDMLSKLREESERIIEDDYSYMATVDDLTYLGFFIGINDYYETQLIMLYTGVLTSEYGFYDASNFYMPVEFDNLRLDGDELDYNYGAILGYNEIANSGWYVDGYDKLQQLWDEYLKDIRYEWYGDEAIGEAYDELRGATEQDAIYIADFVVESEGLHSGTELGDSDLLVMDAEVYYAELVMDGETYNYIGALQINGALGTGPITMLGFTTNIPDYLEPDVTSAYIYYDDDETYYDVTDYVGYLDRGGYRHFYLVNDWHGYNTDLYTTAAQDEIILMFTIRID